MRNAHIKFWLNLGLSISKRGLPGPLFLTSGDRPLDISTLVIAVIGSNAIFSFLQFLIARHDKNTEPETRLLLGIGHDRICYLCLKAIQRGYTTPDEIDNISQIYQPYTDLGGNGSGKEMYQRFLRLPIKEENHDEQNL